MGNIKLSDKELKMISLQRVRSKYRRISGLLTLIFVCAIVALAFALQYTEKNSTILQYVFAIFFVVFAVVLMILSAKISKEAKKLFLEIKKEYDSRQTFQ